MKRKSVSKPEPITQQAWADAERFVPKRITDVGRPRMVIYCAICWTLGYEAARRERRKR